MAGIINGRTYVYINKQLRNFGVNEGKETLVQLADKEASELVKDKTARYAKADELIEAGAITKEQRNQVNTPTTKKAA